MPEERVIRAEIIVEAPIEQVWAAWTTAEGAAGFFAPRCKIEAQPGGRYEMFFDPEAEPGRRGFEGMEILALQPPRMLSFTWNAPPELASVRGHRTHVVIHLRALDAHRTQVTLRHDGWGEGGEWEQAIAYFERAWKTMVLPRLAHRFRSGPIDWDHPPAAG